MNKRIVAMYRITHPLCEACSHEGRIEASAEVHHMKPLAEGGTTADDYLLALCKRHHAGIHGLPPDQQRAMKQPE